MYSSKGCVEINIEPYEKGVCQTCGRTLFARNIPFIGEIILECECEKQLKQKENEDLEAAALERKISNLKYICGMMPLNKNMTFENFERREGTEKAVEEARLYANKFSKVKKGLLFIGTTGSGKTHLACAIGNHLLNEGYDVKFKRAVDLPTDAKRDYNALEPLKKCQLLIVDDMGADTDAQWISTLWLSIIDYRIGYMLPTVITTNLNEEEMMSRFDKRITDRIFGNSHKITITAKSYRQFK